MCSLYVSVRRYQEDFSLYGNLKPGFVLLQFICYMKKKLFKVFKNVLKTSLVFSVALVR